MIIYLFCSIFSAFSFKIPVFCILFFLLYSSVFCFDTFPVFRGITSPLCMIILFFFPCFGSFRFFSFLFYTVLYMQKYIFHSAALAKLFFIALPFAIFYFVRSNSLFSFTHQTLQFTLL